MFAHDHSVSHQALVGGYIVLALALIATLGLAGWLIARRLHRPAIAIQLLVVLVLGGGSFQVVHFFDHLLQLGYWFAHPTETPWMPPWSRVAVDDLATLAGYQGDMAAGMELLHLMGNWIFFAAGVIPLYIALRSLKTERGAMRATRAAFWLQLVHVLEHVSLTSTYLLVGRAIGLSTLFGATFYLGGAWATSIRIWWHFLMNLMVTGAILLALREFRSEGSSRKAALHHSVDEKGAHETPEKATSGVAMTGAGLSSRGVRDLEA
jgi:hypothetical protein